MVFGLFKKKEKKPNKFQEELQDKWRRLEKELDPALRSVVEVFEDLPIHGGIKVTFRELILTGDLDGARKHVVSQIYPALPDDLGQKLKDSMLKYSWMNLGDMIDLGLSQSDVGELEDDLILGRIPFEEGKPGGKFVCFKGEGHLLTVAPTRSGKGQRYIIPNLLNYKGPSVILDPKGENYRETAWRRDMFGPVYKFDPFELTGPSDHYNPLALIKSWEDAVSLADLLVEPMSRDKFWDAAGKELLAGLIYYVCGLPEQEKRNMAEIVRHLSLGKDGLEKFAKKLQKSTNERLRLLGNRIDAEPENLFLSILATLRSQLDIWFTDKVAKATSSTSEGWDMEMLWFNERHAFDMAPFNGVEPGPVIAEGGERVYGEAPSIYLVIPPEKMEAFRSVLRVMIGQHINQIIEIHGRKLNEMQNDPEMPLDAVERMFKSPRWPWLFVLDELPQLGYMAEIERGVSIVGGADIRLWLITQDMAQLSEVYPRWESIVANCKGQVFFQPNDQKTAEIISRRLGTTKTLWGETAPLASPQDLMGPDFADKAVIIFSKHRPIKANLQPPAYEDMQLKQYMLDEQKWWGTVTPRRELEERLTIYPADMEVLSPLQEAEKNLQQGDEEDIMPPDTETDDDMRPKPPGFGD